MNAPRVAECGEGGLFAKDGARLQADPIGVVEGVVAFVLGGESAVSMSLVGGERCLSAMSASDTRVASLAGWLCAVLAVVCLGSRGGRDSVNMIVRYVRDHRLLGC